MRCVCMCVCARCLCMCAYVYVNLYACVRVCVYVCESLSVCVCEYMCVRVCMCLFASAAVFYLSPLPWSLSHDRSGDLGRLGLHAGEEGKR